MQKKSPPKYFFSFFLTTTKNVNRTPPPPPIKYKGKKVVFTSPLKNLERPIFVICPDCFTIPEGTADDWVFRNLYVTDIRHQMYHCD